MGDITAKDWMGATLQFIFFAAQLIALIFITVTILNYQGDLIGVVICLLLWMTYRWKTPRMRGDF